MINLNTIALTRYFLTYPLSSPIKLNVALLSCFLVLYVNAQTTPKDSVTTIEIKEVILTNTFKKNATGITSSAIVNSEILETFSPLDITTSINQVPGVYALSGALNTNRITIRGIGARTPFGTDKLRLYYNNIPITNGTGSSTIEAFDLENLGSIEVIKGPKGTAYGANLGGAILLKSRTPKYNTTVLSNNFTLGSYNLIKDNLSVQHNSDAFYIGLNYNHTYLDGYRENNSFKRNGLLLNTEYRINASNTIGLLVNHIDYIAQIPSSINQTDFNEDPTQAAGNWLAAQGFEDDIYTLIGVHYKGKLSERLENTSSIFYSHLDNNEARPFNILNEATSGYGFRTQFKGYLNINTTKIEYTLGGELYKDKYDWKTFRNEYRDNNGNGSLQGEQISNNTEYRDQLNIFGSFNYPITNKFRAQFNLALNQTTYDFRDLFNNGEDNKSASRSFDPILLPSLSLEYAWSPLYNLYFNVSRGFSNPGLEETLTPDGVINPNIEQEKGMSYEIGSSLKLLENNLLLNISLYQMNIKDLLVGERIGEDQYVGRNAGKTKHQGLEIDANYKFPFIGGSILKPFVRYTHNNHSFVDFIDEGEDFSGNSLTGVPKNKLDAGFYFLLDGFYWNTTYQFVDKIPLTDANTLSSDQFSVFNTKIGYKKGITDKLTLGISIGVNNLFDTKYAQSVLINAVGFGGAEPRYFYPGNNRNYYGSFKVNYRL